MNQDSRDKFESLLLAGRSRENPMVASLLDRGADGEYFNANTRAAFAWFVKGVESVVVVLPQPKYCGDYFLGEYALPIDETREAIEAAGGKVVE